MGPKKLIFFVAAGPGADATSVATAYHFAAAGAHAGLRGEVRLAGDAVLVADPVCVATLEGSMTLRERIDGAGGAGVEVFVCPRSVDAHGIRDEQLAGIGAQPRPLAEILEEVAEGRSVLVYIRLVCARPPYPADLIP